MTFAAAGRLPPQDWIEAPATRRVTAALAAGGGITRFVGGAVRDALLGRPVTDIDLATELPPDVVLARLARAGLKAVPTGLAHGTVTAVADGRGFEITTLRRDVETYGRRAKVAFTDDWQGDADRRDFTLNAIYADPDGTLYDPEGGIADARAGRVRFIGDPVRRIAEDALRILRYFRFLAGYGREAPDPAALAAVAGQRDRLVILPPERLWHELRRLLAAPDPAPSLSAMADSGVLVALLPGASVDRLPGLVAAERRAGAAPAPVRRLAALGIDAVSAVRRLRLSGGESERLAAAVAAAIGGAMDEPRFALVRRIGPAAAEDAALLAAAAGAEAGRSAALLAAARAGAPPLPVGGRDVVALGVDAGPRVGRILAALREWWDAEDCRPDEDAVRARLRILAAADH